MTETFQIRLPRRASWRALCASGVGPMFALATGLALAGKPEAVPTNSPKTETTHEVVTTNTPPSGSVALDFSAFRIIADRNIFNASRSRRAARGEEGPTREVRIESFSVVGTLSYTKGDIAFFDGSGAAFRKAIKVGEMIAGHKLVAIGIDDVEFERGEKNLTLKMGAKMQREDEGAWQLIDATTAGPNSQTGSSSPSTSNDTASSESSDGGVDDALKRLLEKREKDLKNENP